MQDKRFPVMRTLATLFLTLFLCGNACGETAVDTLHGDGEHNLLLTPGAFARMVIEKNAAIKTSQYEVEITAGKLNGEKGLYDPAAFATAHREGRHRLNTVEEQIVSSNLPYLTEKVYTREAGLHGELPSGANYKLSYSIENRTNNVIQSQTLGLENSEYTGNLGITIQQPLIKGFGREVTEIDKNIADYDHKIAIEQYKIQLYKSLGEAFNAYWDAYKSQQIEHLRKENLEDAKALARHAQDRIEAGKLAPSSQLEINSIVLSRNIEYDRAKQSELEKKSRLLSFVSMGDIGSRAISLATDNSFTVNLPTAPGRNELEENLPKWPSYRVEDLRKTESEMRQRYAANQMMPSLNLSLSANGTGYSFEQHRALSLAHSRQYPDWFVELTFEQPIFGNKKAKAQYLEQSNKILEGETAMDAERASYENDLQVSDAGLATAYSAEKQGAQEVALRQELYEKEQQRFLLGSTILSTVVQKSADLIDAKIRHLEAQTNLEYTRFLYNYYRNNVLNSLHITINE